MIPRPCAYHYSDGRGCTEYAADNSAYCAEHRRQHAREHPSPSSVASHKRSHKRYRATIIAQGPPWTCQDCGKRMTNEREVRLDHIEPASRGGPNTPDNYQVLCAPCNGRKGANIRHEPPRKPSPWKRSNLPPWQRDD